MPPLSSISAFNSEKDTPPIPLQLPTQGEESYSQTARTNNLFQQTAGANKRGMESPPTFIANKKPRVQTPSRSAKRKLSSPDQLSSKKKQRTQEPATLHGMDDLTISLESKEDLKRGILDKISSAQSAEMLPNFINEKTFAYTPSDKKSPSYFRLQPQGDQTFDNLTVQEAEAPQDMRSIIQIPTTAHIEEDAKSLSLRVEKELVKKFKQIEEEVKKQGYWKLPKEFLSEVPSRFQAIYGPQTPPSEEQIEEAKALFKRNPPLLERFCSLKIKEISSYLLNMEQFLEPRSSIKLSILREQEKTITVTEVEIAFCREKLACIPISPKEESYRSLLDALFRSSWLVMESKQTIIRFADHLLEDNLVVKLYCNQISYGLLSSEIRRQKIRRLNFWEDLALNKKQREKSDFNQIELVKTTLEKNRSSQQIDLDEATKKLAAFREDTNQEDYVRFILKNQLSGIGTLLNLPTGFGKTFIIFMAVAHHIKHSEDKKPYLVIAPASNVIESWKASYKELKSNPKMEGTALFSADDSLIDFDKTKDFIDAYKDGTIKKADFIVITQTLLSNVVNSFLFPKRDPSQQNNSLDNPELQPYEVVLKLAGISSEKNFILGDESFWENNIRELLSSWRFKEAVLVLLKAEIPEVEKSESFFIKPKHYEGIIQPAHKSTRQELISKFETTFNGDDSLLNRLPEAFRSKITSFNEEGRECVDANRLYDYCDLWIRFEEQFQLWKIADENRFEKLKQLLFSSLNKASEEQKKRVARYDEFKRSFNGLILDESDQIFSLEGNDFSENTNILLDIAKTLQIRTEKNNPQNPLLIASSATPWPNKMDQLKLHLKFLLPTLLGQYCHLHDDLFKQWNSFEGILDKFSDREISQEVLGKSLHSVQTHFYHWIRLLFKESVIYEKPIAGQTNHSLEEILFISCDESCRVSAGAETVSAISSFYSKILKKSSEDTKSMQHQIFTQLNNKDNFAFFVALTEDAASLAMKISDYYETNLKENVEIGFFYNESFVKTPHKNQKNLERYKNIILNTDRMLNVNAFNNIFRFEDFYKYLSQRFEPLDIHKKKNSILLLVDVLQSIQNQEDLPEYSQKKHDALQIMGAKIAQAYKDKRNPSESLEETEKNLYNLLNELIKLEKKSRSQIISDFSQELEEFKQFLPENYQSQEPIAAFQAFKKDFSEEINQKKKKSESITETLSHTLLLYLYKIYQSKILIFGDAGTSGMRIDADHLTLISGAWTEGKLSQIKGRVGRLKGAGDSRECKIYLPITNTRFEFFILRYYIRKALYHLFITSEDQLEGIDLCQQLILSGLLYAHYNNAIDSSFLDASIHMIIQKRGEELQKYLTLGAYEKALAIIPQSIKDDLQKFTREFFPAVQTELHRLNQ